MTTKYKLFLVFLVFVSFSFFTCATENEEDMLPEVERCGEQTVSLSNDVLPIITQNCAVSGCHVSGTSRVNLSIQSNILQHANQIRSFTQSGFMPPERSGNQLTDLQVETIFCWVDQGALDN
ncbi:hypothetical protein SAMN05192553_101284 [Cyclobacterium xiamenense]|uniref:Cytochrome c domain-containing protein n=1 Tax=Cyclobacterium xiamenense TaxID=1297121 RepID=A0A1H6TK39_9BACT|nr:hypothetical protein [Cyclobacterium xiamenense]SEI78544.1 hypothetical protein SAMN05192553_101284 [Cyclobacterium xiamenense]